MLQLAAQRGNVPIVRYLLSTYKSTDMNQGDNRERTILHYAVENKRASDTVTALISHGANPWLRDHDERSVLHHAAKLGNLPAVKALLAQGMVNELRTSDRFGMTPLKIAAHVKAHAVLDFLTQAVSSQGWNERATQLDLGKHEGLFATNANGLLERSRPYPGQEKQDVTLVSSQVGY